MVHPDARRIGYGETMCKHSLKEARKLGFKAIQFNMIVSTNIPAVRLWEKMDLK